MKRGTLILVLAMALVGLTSQAWAAETDTILVTVELETTVSVAVTPVTTWAIGPVGFGDTDASPTYTATNDGNVTVNFTIEADDSGANGWTIGTVGVANVFQVDVTTPALTLTTSPQTLATGVAVAGTATIDMTYTAPSSVSGGGAGGGESHDFSIIVTASAP